MSIEQNAKRYEFLKSLRDITLTKDGGFWTKEGSRFVGSHYLAGNGHKFSPGPDLDSIIDQAMIELAEFEDWKAKKSKR